MAYLLSIYWIQNVMCSESENKKHSVDIPKVRMLPMSCAASPNQFCLSDIESFMDVEFSKEFQMPHLKGINLEKW